jgi:hypothetical protein
MSGKKSRKDFKTIISGMDKLDLEIFTQAVMDHVHTMKLEDDDNDSSSLEHILTDDDNSDMDDNHDVP